MRRGSPGWGKALPQKIRRPVYRFSVRLEHAAHRPEIVAGEASVIQDVPAAAGCRELQSLSQVTRGNSSLRRV